MRRFIIPLMLCLTGCGLHSPTKCVSGHYEHRHDDAWWYNMITYQSDGTMSIIPIYQPEQDYDVWICDKHDWEAFRNNPTEKQG